MIFEECDHQWRTVVDKSYVPNSWKQVSKSEFFPSSGSFTWQLRSMTNKIELFSTSAPPDTTVKVRGIISINGKPHEIRSEFEGKGNHNDVPCCHTCIYSYGYLVSELRSFEIIVNVNIWALILGANTEKSAPNTTFREAYSSTKLLTSISKDLDFSDLTIQVGSKQFHAHRNVFAAVSPVFRATLLNNMKERNTGCITISDFGADIIEKMISFIYTGHIESSDYEVMVELLRASDIYDIETLKNYCMENIKTMMKQDNVIQLILLADINNALDLKQYAIDYFVQNSKSYDPCDFDDIVKMRPQLFPELIVKIFKKLDVCRTAQSPNFDTEM